MDTIESPARRITLEEAGAVVRKQLRGRLPSGVALSTETELEALGLSSLAMTEVFFKLEEMVGIELDPSAASRIRTLGELVETVNAMAVAAQP